MVSLSSGNFPPFESEWKVLSSANSKLMLHREEKLFKPCFHRFVWHFSTFCFNRTNDFNFDAKMWISAKFMKHPSYLFEKKNPWCCKNRDHCTTVYIIEERVLLSRCPLEGVKCIWIRNSSITPSLKAPGHVTTMKGVLRKHRYIWKAEKGKSRVVTKFGEIVIFSEEKSFPSS